MELTLSLKAATEASEDSQGRLHAVSMQLASAAAETAALKTRIDGLELELTGSSVAGGLDRASAVDARDASIRDYFQTTIMNLVRHRHVLLLARSVRDLLESESINGYRKISIYLLGHLVHYHHRKNE